MKTKVTFNNSNTIYNRIFDYKLKLFSNTTLYKLVDPYVPFREGKLAHNVNITKEFVHYKSPHAERMYNGKGFNFSKDKHVLATAYWDKVAMQSQKEKLIKSIENYIKGTVR